MGTESKLVEITPEDVEALRAGRDSLLVEATKFATRYHKHKVWADHRLADTIETQAKRLGALADAAAHNEGNKPHG